MKLNSEPYVKLLKKDNCNRIQTCGRFSLQCTVNIPVAAKVTGGSFCHWFVHGREYKRYGTTVAWFCSWASYLWTENKMPRDTQFHGKWPKKISADSIQSRPVATWQLVQLIGDRLIYFCMRWFTFPTYVQSVKVLWNVEQLRNCHLHKNRLTPGSLPTVCIPWGMTANLINKITVRSPDTDVFVLPLHYSQMIDVPLIWDTGVSNKRQLISINHVSLHLESDTLEALPWFHAFTGCDTTSAFKRKGTRSPPSGGTRRNENSLQFGESGVAFRPSQLPRRPK